MKDGTSKAKSGRRNFLLALGAGGAAAAAAMAVARKKAAVPVSGDAAPRGKGYQLTQHVRSYYSTAKI
jgi:shikimate 5-dehydrogenase